MQRMLTALVLIGLTFSAYAKSARSVQVGLRDRVLAAPDVFVFENMVPHDRLQNDLDAYASRRIRANSLTIGREATIHLKIDISRKKMGECGEVAAIRMVLDVRYDGSSIYSRDEFVLVDAAAIDKTVLGLVKFNISFFLDDYAYANDRKEIKDSETN